MFGAWNGTTVTWQDSDVFLRIGSKMGVSNLEALNQKCAFIANSRFLSSIFNILFYHSESGLREIFRRMCYTRESSIDLNRFFNCKINMILK